MSIFSLFSGAGFEKLEQKGDGYSRSDLWGRAKIEYEKALVKLEKTSPVDPDAKTRLETKIRQAKEELARAHFKEAENLMDGAYFAEAKDMINLAKAVSEDSEFKKELDRMGEEIRGLESKKAVTEFEDVSFDESPETESHEPPSGEAYFMALCGTLPEDTQDAYASYGQTFRDGYIALNHGDFKAAADLLEAALEDHPGPDSHIPLELATAYVNMGRQDEARVLLEPFLRVHPANLPGFRLLCEIYWELEDYEKAEALLSSAPEDLVESVALFQLKGQTLIHMGRLAEARDFYLDFIETYGWNEAISRDLAVTFELLGEKDNARDMYKKILGNCNACQARVDPFIRQKYADLCFEAGLYNTETLEHYLAIAKALPDNVVEVFNRISIIYESMGNAQEARRFKAFGERAEKESG